MMTRDDYDLLREFQMERFREELATVSGAYAALSRDNALTISCQQWRDLEQVEGAIAHLKRSARIILGITEIRIYFECRRMRTY